MMSQRTQSELATASGERLALHTWLPGAEPCGAVVVVHGLGEHAARYEPVAAALNEAGFAVFGADHRGHGRSSGLRGHVDGFGEYVADLADVMTYARTQVPAGPLLMLGHSMGGLIALRYLQTGVSPAADGWVLSNPLLGVAIRPPRIKVLAGRLLSRLLPRLRLDNELVPENISRDPEEVRKYVQDPLVHRHISTRWYTSMTAALASAHADAGAVKAPTLWLLSGQDRICDSTASMAFARALPGKSTTIQRFPDAFHEAHNGPDRQLFLDALVAWAKDQTAS